MKILYAKPTADYSDRLTKRTSASSDKLVATRINLRKEKGSL